jgi:hypothetical protein
MRQGEQVLGVVFSLVMYIFVLRRVFLVVLELQLLMNFVSRASFVSALSKAFVDVHESGGLHRDALFRQKLQAKRDWSKSRTANNKEVLKE